MATFNDIVTWDGTTLRDTGAELIAASRSYEDVYNKLTDLSVDGLEGETAEAEAKARRVLADDAMDLWTALSSSGKNLQDAGDSADAIATTALDIQARANNDNFSITDANQVVDDSGESTSVREGTRMNLKYEVDGVLEQAGDVVTFLSGVYDDIALLGGTAAGPSASVINHGDRQPPASWTPEQVNDWWTSLSDEERQHITNTHPAWIGNLDGIPASDRHAANMVWLPIMKAEIDAQVSSFEPKTETIYVGPGERCTQNTREYQALLDRQKDITNLETQFKRPQKDGEPKHTLLLLDNSGNHFRAAVGSGDIDSADHVMVFTPGMDSTVRSKLAGDKGWGSGVNDTENILTEAERQLKQDGRENETVAGITWLGYDAPHQNELDSSHSVLSQNEAREGSSNLASFYEGLQTTHHGDPHLVAGGHSYGSVTTGLALEQTKAPDDLEVWGSPGTASADASDMNMLPEHMTEATAREDRIGSSAWHGMSPEVNPDFTHMETDPHSDPDNPSKELPGSTGHSEYTKPKDGAPTTSLHNIASVLIGNGPSIPNGG